MMDLDFYWEHFVQLWKTNLEALWTTLAGTFSNPGWLISLLLAFLILQPLEFLVPWHRDQKKLRPQLGIDVFYTLFNNQFMWALFGSALLGTSVLVSQTALNHYFGIRPSDMMVIRTDAMPMWARFVAMYLFADLVEYLGHWASHNVNILWHFHKVHHSSKELDIWNANRFHFVEYLWGGYVSFFAMALIGFPVEEIFLGSLLMGVANIYSHSNIKLPLGPLKYVFNNPQLHIWHHAASVDPRRNVNYGASLAVWDYLLGTAYRPEGRPRPELGFDGDEDFPTGLLAQLLQPFKDIARDWGRGIRRLVRRLPTRRATAPAKT